ncbi:MAG: two-component system response regulator UvrY [Sedimenticola sp.]|jgi:two-component system invasion response regulator UvrY|nr:MAG: two-component system response regulator UvrY [Sedimenticola sp.]
MIRVLIVDDHDLVRTGFKYLLLGADGFEVVGEATSGEQAVEVATQLKPDIILMDVNMPGIGGIEATRKIRRLLPHVHIIAVTVHSDTPFPEQLRDAGALGYINKGASEHELLQAMRVVASGKPYVASSVSQKITLARLNGIDTDSPFNDLSQREMQVLLMVTQGQKTQAISDALCLSPKTVSTYRHRLYEKLGVETDVELTHLVLRYGLIENNG